MIMGIPLKTESIDELVAFLVSKLPDPEKTKFITEFHKKIKDKERHINMDLMCHQFNLWMESELAGLAFTSELAGLAFTEEMFGRFDVSLFSANHERFSVLRAAFPLFKAYGNLRFHLPNYGSTIDVESVREKLFGLAYNSVLRSMCNKLLFIIDNIDELCEFRGGEGC